MRLGLLVNQSFRLPRTIAHRGASNQAPENTLMGLRIAKMLGASWVECDVQFTADFEIIVFHDASLKRITGVKKRVAQTVLSEILELDAGSWFDENFKNERIPTLSQFLAMARELKIGVNIELKGFFKNRLLDQISATIKKEWSSQLPPILISSTFFKGMPQWDKERANFFFGLIFHRWSNTWEERMKKSQAVSIHLPYTVLNSKRIAAIKNKSYILLAYTVNDLLIGKDLLEQGVDGFFTDIPQLFKI